MYSTEIKYMTLLVVFLGVATSYQKYCHIHTVKLIHCASIGHWQVPFAYELRKF